MFCFSHFQMKIKNKLKTKYANYKNNCICPEATTYNSAFAQKHKPTILHVPRSKNMSFCIYPEAKTYHSAYAQKQKPTILHLPRSKTEW